MALLAIWPSFWLRIYASILLVLFFSHISVRSDGESVGDEAALISFKSLITHGPEGALASWGNTSLHFCNWFGVTCSNHSGNVPRVVALELGGIDLDGSISPSLGNLTFLQRLRISETQLSGSIPLEIGSLSNLQYLNLGHNSLSGEIPPSLCNISTLSELYIDANKIEGSIPPCLGNLTSLTSLDLSHSNLTGNIPSSLGYLLKLNVMHLDSNDLYGNIPPSLGNLRFLVQLDLGQNKLSGFIPDSLWNLTFLKELALENNNLIGTLPMKTLPSLKSIYLSTNRLHGTIPASLFNCSALELIQLSENTFDGPIHKNIGNLKNLSKVVLYTNHLQARDINEWSFIEALTNCTKLMVLDLCSNELEGILPHSIVNLTKTLNSLMLDWNNISGNLPIEIGNLVGLNLLRLGPNSLTGTIPVEIEKLKSLQELDLHNNNLSGEIPHNIGNLSILNDLYLNGNNLSGHIPSSLGNCTQLTVMYLQHNKLIGSIPNEIFSITSLSFGIDLSNNFLTGQLSTNVGLLISLQFLALSNNKLTGQIPSNLAYCVQLKKLYMENNLLQGNIPSSLRALKSLEKLDLSHNKLDGKIPEFLESLHQLNLSYNHLEGEVPRNGVFLNTSAFSVYGNDKLCGGIMELKLPPCIMNTTTSRNKHGLTMLLATIIPIILILIILFLIFSIWRRKKSKNLQLMEKVANDQNHIKVSYAELQRATNGFSSHNLIGRGSFGSVYIGNMDHNWHKSIVIKVLNLQQRGASKSFEAECKALKNIRHRNLVRILTSCSSIDQEGNDFKALVFEYMPNGNLDKFLHQQSIFDKDGEKKLTIIQRMNIIIEVACALDYLHNHGPTPVVHCDLKPSNILLDEDMVAHVSDFGSARLLIEATMQSSQTSTSSIALKGTIGYTPPEYGVANQVSIEGDVYSYGIILLEMFTGRRPTDQIFNEDLNLHVFVKAALPKRLMDIVDPYLLLQEKEDDEVGEGLLRMKCISKHELECLVSMLKVGLLCSKESPTERMPITPALNELYTIRNTFLKSSNDTAPTHL